MEVWTFLVQAFFYPTSEGGEFLPPSLMHHFFFLDFEYHVP